jgi:hypothetical protein
MKIEEKEKVTILEKKNELTAPPPSSQVPRQVGLCVICNNEQSHTQTNVYVYEKKRENLGRRSDFTARGTSLSVVPTGFIVPP